MSDPMPTIYNIIGWTETHEHEYYGVQFSWGGYVECECGYRPTEAEFNGNRT